MTELELVKSKFTRAGGRLETMIYQRTKLRLYKNFMVSCKFNQQVSENLLFHALRRVILEHPFLACQAYTENDLLQFRINDYVKFEDVVEYRDVDFSDELLRELELSDSNFNQLNLPLVKVVALRNNEFVLVTDHILFDGESCSNFWIGIYDAIVSLSQESLLDHGELLFVLEDDYKLIKDTNNTAPMDLWIEFLPSWKRTLESRLRKLIPDLLKPLIADRSYNLPAPIDCTIWKSLTNSSIETPLAFRMIYFSKDELSFILKQCKQHAVTLTPYMDMVVMISAIPWLSELGENNYIRGNIPISYRRHIPAENFEKYDLSLGNIMYLGATNHTPVPVARTFSWNLVREISDNLKRATEDAFAIQNLNGPPLSCEEAVKAQMSILGKPRTDTFRLSNLGLIKFDPKGTSWRCERMGFIQNPGVTGGNFNCSVISTTNGLTVGISFADEGSFKDIDRFITDFKVNMLRTYP